MLSLLMSMLTWLTSQEHVLNTANIEACVSVRHIAVTELLAEAQRGNQVSSVVSLVAKSSGRS